jgi:hypothetical protein
MKCGKLWNKQNFREKGDVSNNPAVLWCEGGGDVSFILTSLGAQPFTTRGNPHTPYASTGTSMTGLRRGSRTTPSSITTVSSPPNALTAKAVS